MKNSPSTLPISALHEILRWSASTPDWQKDALRRIVTQPSLTDQDVDELERLCRARHGSDTSAEDALAPMPLSASHLPAAPGAGVATILVSLGNLQRVNRLPSDQTLRFGPGPGLTVIFGGNGSGKSGYARVIKNACRSRGASPAIRPNAYDRAAPATPASADIVFMVAGTEHSITWHDNTASDARLANIFVFDASTAKNYLESDGPAAFTPHGLDVLPKLSKLCDAIAQRIKRDIDSLASEIATVAKNWSFPASTEVGRTVTSLSATTKVEDIERLALFSLGDAARLAEIVAALQADPEHTSKATRASGARLREFAQLLRDAGDVLADARTGELQQLKAEADSSAQVARAFAAQQFDKTHLPGTGGDVWKSLWAAARDYAAREAWTDRPFPAATGEPCLLCQRPLDDHAAARMRRFDAYFVEKSVKLADSAAERLRLAAQRLETLPSLDQARAVVDADLASGTAELRAATDASVAALKARLATVKANLQSATWAPIQALPESAIAPVLALATQLDERAALEQSAADPSTRQRLLRERDELLAREWLSKAFHQITGQLQRLKRLRCLKASQDDTATRPITEKSTDLTQRVVTDTFRQRFQGELDALGLRTIKVELQELRGAKGATLFGLRLLGASSHKLHEIASDGEQRCVALAAFLAELSQQSHHSALVFDDPVSSLDHGYRERIARRLVAESKLRQVIVYTHDTVLLHELGSCAAHEQVTPEFRFVEWVGERPGCCHEGLPWDCKSPEDRLHHLQLRQRELARTWPVNPDEAAIHAMRQAYSWLRNTLERSIERVIFADVIFRFRSQVKVGNLRAVVNFTQQECDEVLRLHEICSEMTEAHDFGEGKQPAVRDPNDLAADITALKSLLEAVAARRKATKVTLTKASAKAKS